jgi:anti-sigma B factor antagonist
MEYSYAITQQVGVYTLKGSIIGENDGMPLNEDFNERVEQGTRHFIIDLSEIKHINSTGLGALITLLTKARKKDGDVVLVNPSEYIRNLMMITKLNTIFHIYPDKETARLALSRKS